MGNPNTLVFESDTAKGCRYIMSHFMLGFFCYVIQDNVCRDVLNDQPLVKYSIQ